VGAELKSAPHGRYWLRRCAYRPQDFWGEMLPEEDCALADARGLRIPLTETRKRVPLRKCLFIDCETTGLSGGAGTISFLTAVGQFRRGAFVVDQYFLPDPSDELAVLEALEERFAHSRALITYNGSSFDLPLLEGRFNFWRLEPAFRSLPHLDLLWPTRSLFKHRIGDCSLGSVEEKLLRLSRVEDLPGSEVPEVYFQYLHEGESPRLHAVFEHNRFDVVSLFVYALWLDPRTDPNEPSLSDPDDLWALARMWHRGSVLPAALYALDAARERVLSGEQRSRVAELRARILKRARAYDDAHREWEAASKSSQGRTDISEELAKHLEHRRRDFAGALKIVDEALQALRFRALAEGEDIERLRRDLIHRRARLRRRLKAQEEASR
jgi:hypothetical protein